MMDEYRLYREAAIQTLLEQKELRLELRGGKMLSLFAFSFCFLKCFFYLVHWRFGPCLSGVDTDELDSNVEDWEEETIEFFINEEIIPLGDL